MQGTISTSQSPSYKPSSKATYWKSPIHTLPQACLPSSQLQHQLYQQTHRSVLCGSRSYCKWYMIASPSKRRESFWTNGSMWLPPCRISVISQVTSYGRMGTTWVVNCPLAGTLTCECNTLTAFIRNTTIHLRETPYLEQT